MEVSKETLVQLREEGIKEVEDPSEFSKEIWKQVAENLKCPGGWMRNLDKKKDDSNPSTIPQNPVSVWGQGCKRDSSRHQS
eukprot:13257388-Ditylum_brightwellii.AAC.1